VEERQAQENEILLELPPEHPLRASSTPPEDYDQTRAHIAVGLVLGIMIEKNKISHKSFDHKI